MRVPECLQVRLHLSSAICLVAILGLALSVWGQGSYRAQLRGVVSDATGAVVAHATVTIRDVGTNIASSAHTDDKGSYFFTGLRPSTYALKVEAPGFRPVERTGVVLAVDQEPKEGMKLDVRAEIFNFTNHPRFGFGSQSLPPNLAFGDSQFGLITNDAPGYTPRYFQFGLRFEF